MPNGQIFLPSQKLEQLWYISKCHLQVLSINFTTYCIAGNFRGEKNVANWWKYNCGENFCRSLAFAVAKDTTPQISWRKLSWIGTKLQNSQKFSAIRYPGTTLQCTLLKKNKNMNYWTHCSSWRHWFTRKASLSAHTPSSLIWFPLRLQNVREQEMRGDSTNLFTLCKVYWSVTSLLKHSIRHCVTTCQLVK